MNKPLIALAIGGFGIGFTEFVIMGILPDVAADLAISIPRAGHFISAYALGVVVGAPTLTTWGNRWPAHRVLIGLMLWFTVFNTLSGLAWNYESLLTLRFLSGLPHGAFFGISAVVATKLSGEGKGAHAISTIFAGFTLANVIGVPLGTYFGQQISWGTSFFLVGIVGALAVITIGRWVPVLPPSSARRLADDLEILKNAEIWMVLLLCVVASGAFFSWYSYIAPLVTEVAGHPDFMVGVAMTLAGIGMAIGNFVGAKLSEKFAPVHAVIIILSLLVVLLVANALLASDKVLILVMTFVIGTAAFSMSTPIQLTMIQSARGSETLGASINQSAFNIGNAAGAYLAGIPIAMGYGFASADYVGAGLMFIGVLLAIGVARKKRNQARNTEPGS